MEDFLAAREQLSRSMQEAKQIGKSLEKSGEALLRIRSSREELEECLNPLISKFRESRIAEESLDRALEPASSILQATQAIKEMEGLVSRNPLRDIRGYLTGLEDLQKLMLLILEKYPQMIEALIQAIHVANDTRFLYELPKMQRVRKASQNLDLDSQRFLKLGSELMEKASERLEEAFIAVLKNRCQTIIDLKAVDEEKEVLDLKGIDLLKLLAEKLRSFGKADKCLKIFRSLRLRFLREMFKTMNPYYLQHNSAEKIDDLEWHDLENFVGEWLVALRKTVKITLASERRLCRLVFEDFGEDRWTECFRKLAMGTGMAALIDFGEAVAQSNREPQKLFKLLDMIEGLEGLKKDLEMLFQSSGCTHCKLRIEELTENLIYSSLQVLEDFSKQIESESGLPVDGSLPKLTSYVLNYLKYMVSEYGDLMTQVLKRGNSKSDLADIVSQVFSALENNLENKAKRYTSSGLSHIYLMNNYWYLFKRSRDSKLSDVLGEAWLKQRRRLVNQHVLAYEKDVWGPLVMALSREGLGSGTGSSSSGKTAGKELFKQRIRSFYGILDKIYETHRNWVISDNELREGTFVKILQSVVPAYRSYIDTYGTLLDHNSSEVKVLRYSPEELEELLAGLFTKRNNK